MQVLSATSHLAALAIDGERGRGDGAAALVRSTDSMRELRETIARIAATDFTVLIEGGISAQSHPAVGVLV